MGVIFVVQFKNGDIELIPHSNMTTSFAVKFKLNARYIDGRVLAIIRPKRITVNLMGLFT